MYVMLCEVFASSFSSSVPRNMHICLCCMVLSIQAKYIVLNHDVESLAKRIDFSMQTKWAHMGFWLLLLLLVFEMMAWSYTQFEDNFQFGIQNVCIRNILPKTRSAYSLAWWNNGKMVEGSLLLNTYTNIKVLRFR